MAENRNPTGPLGDIGAAVGHAKRHTAQVDLQPWRERIGPRAVVITALRIDRRDGPQSAQYPRAADIPGVQNQMAA